MTAPVSAAGQVVQKYGYDLRALGADSVQATGPNTVTAVFTNNFQATQAAFAVRDAIDGATLVIDNQSTTRDLPHPSVEGVKQLMIAHPGVNGVGRGVGDPLTLRINTVKDATAERLAKLLRPELPDSTPVEIRAIGEIRPQSI